MSLSLSPYLVDLDKARGAIGSKDEKLRRMIGGKFKNDMSRADDWFSHEIGNGAPSRYDALRAVIDGGPFDEKYGFQYGYAYEMICGFFGKHLYNNPFSPFRGDWLGQVDAGLARLGITAVEVGEFTYSPPSPLPLPEGFPGYGEWSVEDCAKGLAQWEASAEDQRAALDREVLEAVECCVDWMLDSGGTGRAVVGFHS